jgi:hypothetical protein
MKMFGGKMSAGRRFSLVACGLLLSGLLSPDAPAQSLPNAPMGPGNIATGRRNGAQGAPEPPAIPAPDAVPGAKARQPVAPATHPPIDLAPNEALFDAINRGDIAAARDALGRGADLDAVNILGMTPMELSVDLGRNDISFLLLSMRGEDSGRGARAAATGAPPAKTAAAKGPGTKMFAPAKQAPVAVRQLATPKLFANDGGTPVPSAGFLGFDSRSASN